MYEFSDPWCFFQVSIEDMIEEGSGKVVRYA